MQVVRLLAVAMREETTARSRYLIRLLPQAAAAVVLHLFLLLMAKMAVRAAGVRNQRQAAQEFRDKVLQVVQA